ncbi:unnamed protein product [Gongylonema pulchrum]|uniref:Uncharacterized protein n=1 Tax=Gongylonema pulchrum TaxID=637853 RepID=A0A3P6P1L8_9BILA|nr:unnamed protein product [Gongylonema pulchrum]
MEVDAESVIDDAFDNSLNSSIDPILGDPTLFRESCRTVIHRNINVLGFLFRLVFPEEFAAKEDSDVIVID